MLCQERHQRYIYSSVGWQSSVLRGGCTQSGATRGHEDYRQTKPSHFYHKSLSKTRSSTPFFSYGFWRSGEAFREIGCGVLESHFPSFKRYASDRFIFAYASLAQSICYNFILVFYSTLYLKLLHWFIYVFSSSSYRCVCFSLSLRLSSI